MEDEETALRMVEALPGRTDLYMEDIIEGIFYQQLPLGKGERCLEMLLGSLIYRQDGDKRIDLWLAENTSAFELLVRNMFSFKNA
ncbi:unnamed protein product, partial [marine sediment metagenome]